MTQDHRKLSDLFRDGDPQEYMRALFSVEDLEKTAKAASASAATATREHLDGLIERSLDQLLDISIGDILWSAWVKLSVLREYATGEKLESDKIHSFALASHKITSVHTPRVELILHNKKVTEASVDIKLKLKIDGAILKIKKGRIIKIIVGNAGADGELASHGATIMKRSFGKLNLPAAFEFPKGIKIAPPLRQTPA